MCFCVLRVVVLFVLFVVVFVVKFMGLRHCRRLPIPLGVVVLSVWAGDRGNLQEWEKFRNLRIVAPVQYI